MIIKFTSDTGQEYTRIDTEQVVLIDDAYIGPIFTNGDVCLAVFARDDGFELNCWYGDPNPNDVLPEESVMAYINPQIVGRRDLTSSFIEEDSSLLPIELEIGDLENSELQLAVDIYQGIKSEIVKAAEALNE